MSQDNFIVWFEVFIDVTEDIYKKAHYMTIFHFVISGWQNIECKSLIQHADWVEILYKIVTNVS
ncbi:MAG TPA: hypothetical protein LFW10_03870, partial [Rickettsia endosymbiont of Diachasma alloeum]|nr:hypothetical protein [Rickettsia endosymbiont of Diachasma alloeum]